MDKSEPLSRRGAANGPHGGAVVASSAALIVTLYFHHLDRNAAISDRLVEHRRAALFDALRVIDHVYSEQTPYSHRQTAAPWTSIGCPQGRPWPKAGTLLLNGDDSIYGEWSGAQRGDGTRPAVARSATRRVGADWRQVRLR